MQLPMFERTCPISKPALNSDGVSVKGCSIIYAPSGQAGEYALLATNPYRGCDHGCTYCYVPQILRMSRHDFNNDVQPRKNFLARLRSDAAKYQAAGITEQVMLSFTTDPYHHLDERIQLTRQTIQVLKDHGLAFCTLTKGGRRALRDIDLFRSDRDAFATTLTSLSASVSLDWEPNAALPGDRIETLRAFHDAGIFTWVSLEPVYDRRMTLQVIETTHEFVDLFKIGRINYHRLTKEIDWQEFTQRAIELCDRLGAHHYFKKDLQSYLPAGYENVKRRPQHH